MNISIILWVAIASGSVCLISALLPAWVRLKPGLNDKVCSIVLTIRKGTFLFLLRQYLALALVAIPVDLALTYLGGWTANGFIAGVVGTVLAGHLGALAALKFGIRTLEVSDKGVGMALHTAFHGGSASGLAASGMALWLVSGYYTLVSIEATDSEALHALLGVGLGAALAGLFSRIAGGLYASAVEALLNREDTSLLEWIGSERDPSLLATQAAAHIAESVGLSTDLCESLVLAMVAGMLLAGHTFGTDSPWILFPLLIGSLAPVAFVMSHSILLIWRSSRSLVTLYGVLLATVVLSVGAYYFATQFFLTLSGLGVVWGLSELFGVLLLGVFLAVALLLLAEYQTQGSFNPVKRVAAAARNGQSATLFAGLANGQRSVLSPVVLSAVALVGAYFLGSEASTSTWDGLFSMALAIIAALSLGTPVVALSTFASIVVTTRGIAEVAGMDGVLHDVTDSLNRTGHTVKALARIYATLTAGLTALILFAEFSSVFLPGIGQNLDLSTPYVLSGFIGGGLLVYWLSGRLLSAVTMGVNPLAQWADTSGCQDGIARFAVRQTLLPVIVVIIVPVVVGLSGGYSAMVGFLLGGIAVGLLQAIAVITSGNVLSHARQYIEDGRYGGSRSSAHEAALKGEIVGIPLRLLVGPAMATLGKLTAVTALLLVPYLS